MNKDHRLICVRCIPVLLVFALVVLLPNTVYAHRSGCHRWHSCPSDTGSYVCGDLGYFTYCGYDSLTTARISRIEVPQEEPAVGYGIVNAVALRVRRDAGRDYEAVDSLAQGTRIEILEQRSGWLRIRYSNRYGGWVSADYVSNDSEAIVAPRASGATSYVGMVLEANVLPDVLNIREYATTNSEKIGQLRKGNVVLITARTPDNRWVARLDGGWLFAGFLDIAGDVNGLPTANGMS